MVDVQVIRGPGGDLLVGVPEAYEPLNLFLQLDVQHDPDFLEDLIRETGDDSVERYEVAADTCWVSFLANKVTVGRQDDRASTEMSREDFREALLSFRRALAAPPPPLPRTGPRWQPPF